MQDGLQALFEQEKCKKTQPIRKDGLSIESIDMNDAAR